MGRLASEWATSAAAGAELPARAELPPLHADAPVTFLSRGVAVPFTTPVLCGTRARLSDGGALELVIPNPSGGRGVYIVPWTGVASLCRPCLHDRELIRRLVEEVSLSPSVIRRVALGVAADGLAGEDVRAAAAAAVRAEQQAQTVVHFRLLMALLAQAGGQLSDCPDLSMADLVAERARHTLEGVAAQLGRPPSWASAALEQVAGLLGGVGVGHDPEYRMPRLLESVRRLQAGLAAWAAAQQEPSERSYGEMVCDVAGHTLRVAGPVMERLGSLSEDVTGILRAWSANPAEFAVLVTRPEWLVDGWEHLCLLWDAAGDEPARRAALAEMAGLIPMLPKEAGDWSQRAADGVEAPRFRKFIRLHEDWLSGAMDLDLMARNEGLRAAACRGPDAPGAVPPAPRVRAVREAA